MKNTALVSLLLVATLTLGGCGTIGIWASGGHQKTFGGIITDAEMVAGMEKCLLNQNMKHRREYLTYVAATLGFLDMPFSLVADLIMLIPALFSDSASTDLDRPSRS